MSFQSRLLLVQLVMILFLVTSMSLISYSTSANMVQTNARANLQALAGKMTQQLDNLIKPMDFISINLLSDGKFMSSMKNLALMDRENPENTIHLLEAHAYINKSLLNYTIARDYFRVSVFNDNGDFLNSRIDTTLTGTHALGAIGGIPWKEEVQQRSGKMVVLPPYEDPWNTGFTQQVFSVSRTFRSSESNVGFIEVQGLYNDLVQVFDVPQDNPVRVLALTTQEDVLFSREMTEAVQADAQNVVLSARTLPWDKQSTPSLMEQSLGGQDVIMAISHSPYTGVTLLLAQDRAALLGPLSTIRTNTLYIASALILLALLYLYLFSRHMTRPLIRLKQEIEQTEFANLPDQIRLQSTSNDEIEALNKAFVQLRERLHDSLDREISAQNLHLRASFEALQARVNPHFIYNILNVISDRGLQNKDPEIHDICQSIAAMLRYSTATSALHATIGEESTHVAHYLKLMKKRFEHLLHYEISLPEEILPHKVPKMLLQPLVENAINHGFTQNAGEKRLSVTGMMNEGGWCIAIEDNGQGFSSQALKHLLTHMTQAKKSNIVPDRGEGVEGMGILNVYSRLMLLSNDSAVSYDMILENRMEGGARVKILCQHALPEKEKEATP